MIPFENKRKGKERKELVILSVKTYLQQQFRLVSLSSYDLFTDEEYDLYMKIVAQKNELDRLDEEGSNDDEWQEVLDKKSELKLKLENLINDHNDKPRTVRLKSVIYYPKDAPYPFPEGVTYKNLKTSKKIAEFCCELSRAMGLNHLDKTLDLIVVKWKNIQILRQLVMNGFIVPVLTPDGIENKHYRFFSASAGQLRRDKIVLISDEAWEKVHNRLECGMNWELINERGSLNPNKYMAYLSLSSSATEEWTDFDIDRCIVVDDFEDDVTDRMMYIKPDYTYEIGVRTVKINHTDGCGMMLPEVSESNFMVRGDWIKGLLGSFDFIRFCKVNGIKPIVKDAWGVEHDLEKERINVILTTSMFKLYKLYRSWEEYKKFYKENDCRFCRTNYEEDYIKDTTVNYQMIQTLIDFSDDEIKQFIEEEHDRIMQLTKDKTSMLNTLKASEESEMPYNAALAIYPELLREAYSRETLKNIRRRMLLDAKSGKIRCENKRLYILPDFYAACEHWFMGIEHPKGLLAKDEVACKLFRLHDKADVLRSPHLYLEHSVQRISHDPRIYEWFYTNAIHSSIHSMISRILQFDCDGDQLNVIVDPLFVEIAERNVRKFDIVPLFYEAEKAKAEPISNESLFNGLKRAHEFSNIGEISNMLTRLWNKDIPDKVAAALLTYLNNLRIDGAKTGIVHEYTNNPQVAKQIGRATGGKNGRMPFFFKFSKNGRKDTPKNRKKRYADINNSTMNRICKAFDDIGNINLNYAGVAQFNWQMLLSEPCPTARPDITEMFCEMDSSNLATMIETRDNAYSNEKQLINGYDLIAEDIVERMEEKYESLEFVYPFIAKYLFAGEGMNKASHKQMFWRVFGEIALRNLKHNLANCDTCPDCGMKVPNWVNNHNCVKNTKGFYACIDCGIMCERINSKQCRCDYCQDVYKATQRKARQRAKRELAKEYKEQRTTRLLSSSTGI